MSGRHAKNAWRGGAALVEMAICLPLLGVLTFATIEACTMIYFKKSLTISAYEGGRTALRPGATSSEVIADCQQVIQDRGIQDAQYSVTPSNIVGAPVNSYIEIVVSAPCSSNLIAGNWFFGGRTIAGEAAVMKEY